MRYMLYLLFTPLRWLWKDVKAGNEWFQYEQMLELLVTYVSHWNADREPWLATDETDINRNPFQYKDNAKHFIVENVKSQIGRCNITVRYVDGQCMKLEFWFPDNKDESYDVVFLKPYPKLIRAYKKFYKKVLKNEKEELEQEKHDKRLKTNKIFFAGPYE